jgi:hypothetical protein
MFRIKNKDKRTLLEVEIDNLILEMKHLDKTSDDYAALATLVEGLYKAKSYDSTQRMTTDAKVSVAANLLGIILILTYEKADIITSRAISFVSKGRV